MIRISPIPFSIGNPMPPLFDVPKPALHCLGGLSFKGNWSAYSWLSLAVLSFLIIISAQLYNNPVYPQLKVHAVCNTSYINYTRSRHNLIPAANYRYLNLHASQLVQIKNCQKMVDRATFKKFLFLIFSGFWESACFMRIYRDCHWEKRYPITSSR